MVEGRSRLVDVLANDSDPDGDTLRLTDPGSPENGTATLDNNRIRYQPDARFVGTDSFTYTVFDGTDTATATVTVRVTPRNRAPVAVDDGPVLMNQYQTVTINVVANDTEPDGDPVTIQIVSAPAEGFATVVSATSIRYEHDPYSTAGSDSFTYRLVDDKGAASGTATVSISINRRPTAVSDGPVVVQRYQRETIDVLANDSDPDGDPLTIQIVSNPTEGTATVVGNMIEYDHDFYGGLSDSFTYRVLDDGGLQSFSATVTIDVNRPPTAFSDQVTAGSSGTYNFNVITATGTDGPTPPPDSDPDGDSLTLTGITGTPPNGSITCGATGACTWTSTGSGCSSSSSDLDYTISDGRGGTATGRLTLRFSPIC